MTTDLRVNETGPLDYLRALRAVDRLNSRTEELGVGGHVESNDEIIADVQTASHVAVHILEIYPPLVCEAFEDVPVVEVKSVVGWLISKLNTEEDFDVAKALVRWAIKRGKDEEEMKSLYSEAQEIAG